MTSTRRKATNQDSLALPFNDDELSLPAAINQKRQSPAAKTTRTKDKRRQDRGNPQAFLPGMSRRGRPRAKQAVAATERAANSRRRRLGSGAKRVELVLDAESVAKLDALAARFDETRAAVVSRLLAKAAARLLK